MCFRFLARLSNFASKARSVPCHMAGNHLFLRIGNLRFLLPGNISTALGLAVGQHTGYLATNDFIDSLFGEKLLQAWSREGTRLFQAVWSRFHPPHFHAVPGLVLPQRAAHPARRKSMMKHAVMVQTEALEIFLLLKVAQKAVARALLGAQRQWTGGICLLPRRRM